MSTVVQLFGAALVVAAVAMLAGLWWAVGLAGLALVALGYLAERASGPRSAPSDRPHGPNSDGVTS